MYRSLLFFCTLVASYFIRRAFSIKNERTFLRLGTRKTELTCETVCRSIMVTKFRNRKPVITCTIYHLRRSLTLILPVKDKLRPLFRMESNFSLQKPSGRDRGISLLFALSTKENLFFRITLKDIQPKTFENAWGHLIIAPVGAAIINFRPFQTLLPRYRKRRKQFDSRPKIWSVRGERASDVSQYIFNVFPLPYGN